jgi:hypothetical protein
MASVLISLPGIVNDNIVNTVNIRNDVVIWIGIGINWNVYIVIVIMVP